MLRSFLVGAAGYPALEVLFRGRTHYSMALAGGLSTALIQEISRLPLPRLPQIALCALGITAVEYGCGRVWNRSYGVWDYRHVPMNVQGQVCLPYTLLWCGMSAAALTVLDAVR